MQIVQNMLHIFKLEYNNITINTERWLVQCSCLFPVLFNLFINDLIIIFRTSKIEARGYADDIVWIWESKAQAVRAIKVMNKWTEINRMEINAEKSGIMRVLKIEKESEKELKMYWIYQKSTASNILELN